MTSARTSLIIEVSAQSHGSAPRISQQAGEEQEFLWFSNQTMSKDSQQHFYSRYITGYGYLTSSLVAGNLVLQETNNNDHHHHHHDHDNVMIMIMIIITRTLINKNKNFEKKP